MRHIDLWAWTCNPSDIPKHVWLIFMHRPSDRSSAVFVTKMPLEPWQQGVCHEVFV